MKIYTGNFANIKKYTSMGLYPISIARSARYYNGDRYPLLAPDYDFMNFEQKEYTPLYITKILGKITVQKALNDIAFLSKGKDVVLLCHEKEGEFCHRRLVAEWIQRETNIEVKELGSLKNVKINYPLLEFAR